MAASASPPGKLCGICGLFGTRSSASKAPVASKTLDSVVTPVPSVQEQAEEECREQKSRLQVALRFLPCLVLTIVFCALFFKFKDDFVDCLKYVGGKLHERKDEGGMVVANLVISSVFYIFPSPGRMFWILLLGFIYGWWGMAFLLFGRFVGPLIAFLAARYLWKHWQASGRSLCGAVACCRMEAEIAKLMLLIQAIEEMPMRTILLLGLSPAPTVLMSYVLGAKATNLKWWQYSFPMALSGVKLFSAVFLGTELKSIHEVTLGAPTDKNGKVVTVISVVCGILAAVLIGYACRRQLLRLEQQCASKNETKGPSATEAGEDSFQL